MSAEMRFPAEAVRDHASTIAEIAGQLDLARSAVHEVSMGRDAYGEICQFLPGLLEPLFNGALDALTASVDSLSETAFKLRTTADTVEATDAHSARQVTEAGGGPVLPL
ncbi:type VII secretion target [Actinoplanes couchii]|uniref:ESX-1 secretion-associated protein n=1 Tax=Actinoplanes couchii TaxID=403638 RepID=A0ABQ3WZX2_9ACTN|nr:type VII secretion target [Actinoplanes couchii]MDR6316220.1 hypothetical protein [Actinoplanes couchii]GID51834.1 hypothetical protein Aco03nite_002380 [Actinoplanes couchii]